MPVETSVLLPLATLEGTTTVMDEQPLPTNESVLLTSNTDRTKVESTDLLTTTNTTLATTGIPTESLLTTNNTGDIPKLESIHPNSTGCNITAPTTALESKPNETATNTKSNKPKRRGPKPKIKLPMEPRLIQNIPKRKEYTNHTYHDFSMIPMDPNYVKPTKMDDMSFVEKIHDILSKPEYISYICWKPSGRTFGIIIPSMFEKIVCPIYFQHKRYSSFLRQLNNHGFKHLTNEHGPNRNCYYHECFLRNMEYLCQYMPEPKDARRSIPDPGNEPDFDAISSLYPVPPPPLAPPQPTIPPEHSMIPTTLQTQLSDTVAPAGQPLHHPSTTTTTGAKKMTMDRTAALAELSKLQEELTSESAATDSSSTIIAPVLIGDKRRFEETNDTILSNSKKLKLGAMPQAFPNSSHKNHRVSQSKREAILAAVRKQKEKEKQQEEQLQQQPQPQPQVHQTATFSAYPSQHQQQQRLASHLQPQHQFQRDAVSDYNANPTSTYNTAKQSLYAPQQPSHQNPFQQERQFSSQLMGQHQPQHLQHSHNYLQSDLSTFQQLQQTPQQQVLELRNQLFPQPELPQTPQYSLPIVGTGARGMNRNRNTINGNNDNTHYM